MRMLLVVARAGLDPALDDGHLSFGEERTSGSRHPFADNARSAFEFLDDVAVVRIAWNDADRTGLAAARDADERCIRDLVTQVQTAAWSPAADVGVALGACRAPGRISGFENLVLNARERRLQIRRRPRKIGELFIASRCERAERDKQDDPERPAVAGFKHGGTQVKGCAATCKAGSDLLGRSFYEWGAEINGPKRSRVFFAGKWARIT